MSTRLLTFFLKPDLEPESLNLLAELLREWKYNSREKCGTKCSVAPKALRYLDSGRYPDPRERKADEPARTRREEKFIARCLHALPPLPRVFLTEELQQMLDTLNARYALYVLIDADSDKDLDEVETAVSGLIIPDYARGVMVHAATNDPAHPQRQSTVSYLLET